MRLIIDNQGKVEEMEEMIEVSFDCRKVPFDKSWLYKDKEIS